MLLELLFPKKQLMKSELFKRNIERCSFQFTYLWRGAHTKLTSCTCFYLACVIESNTLKKDRGKINLCAMVVLPWLFQSSTHSPWEWHAIISFNLLDVSTCCSLLQFVFNFKKLVYSFDTKHWQKFFRAPFPVEFLHGR